MTDRKKARTWAEIDLEALGQNYMALRAMLPEGCRFLAPVKANAYGHGAVRVAQKLEELGADYLGVACLEEAAELREAGISLPILCLGPTPAELTEELLHFRVTQTVERPEAARALSAAALAMGRELTVHLKIDTGMGRLGFLWTEDEKVQEVCWTEICDSLALPGLRFEGMFTHFAAADGDEGYTRTQLARFLDLRRRLEDRGICPEICHCAASAAVLHYPQTHLDMVRPGLALYGYYPDEERMGLPELHPVMRLKSRVSAVRRMPAGSRISYGGTAVLERDSLVAVLPVGYGDGLPRTLSGKLKVRLGDGLYPVLGRICMDLCMVDVTDRPETAEGDVAELYGPGLTDQDARLADTISYELVAQVSPRVPRICCGRDGESI